MTTIPRPEPRALQHGQLASLVADGRWSVHSNRTLLCRAVSTAAGLAQLLELCRLTCAPEPVLRINPADPQSMVVRFDEGLPVRARGARPALDDYTAASLSQLDGEQRLRETARRLLHAVAIAADQLNLPQDYRARPCEYETGCKSAAATDRIAFVLRNVEVPLRVLDEALHVLDGAGTRVLMYAITRVPDEAAMLFEFIIPAC